MASTKPSSVEVPAPSQSSGAGVGSSLAANALSQARRIGAEYGRVDVGSANAKVPVIWVGGYLGSWSSSGKKYVRESGSFSLRLNDQGVVSDCIIQTSTVGDLPCAGSVDSSGTFAVVLTIGTVTIDLHGQVAGTDEVRVSGTWISSDAILGGGLNGLFRGSKGAWR